MREEGVSESNIKLPWGGGKGLWGFHLLMVPKIFKI